MIKFYKLDRINIISMYFNKNIMDLTKRSASLSLSWYDVISWAKNTFALLIPIISLELLKLLPVAQVYLLEQIGFMADGNSTIIILSTTIIGSVALLLKKWLTNYTK